MAACLAAGWVIKAIPRISVPLSIPALLAIDQSAGDDKVFVMEAKTPLMTRDLQAWPNVS